MAELKTFNHAYTLSFQIDGSRHEEGADITQEQFVEAILKRLMLLVGHNQLVEAVGAPFDTYSDESK